MFGLYYSGHPDQLWRPILMFALFALLMIPLFLPPGVPRRAPSNTGEALLIPFRMPNFRFKLLLGAFVIFVYPFIAFALVHGEWLGLEVATTDQWGGFMLTFFLAAGGIVAAFPIGILMALGRRSEMPIIRTICVSYIEFWRGTPLITVLFMASVMLPLFFPAEVDFDKVARALIGITMFQSAYTAEAIRGGLQAIERGQFEGADSLGLGYWKKNDFCGDAAGAQNLDPRHRQHFHRTFQGHFAGAYHRLVRFAEHGANGVALLGLEGLRHRGLFVCGGDFLRLLLRAEPIQPVAGAQTRHRPPQALSADPASARRRIL